MHIFRIKLIDFSQLSPTSKSSFQSLSRQKKVGWSECLNLMDYDTIGHDQLKLWLPIDQTFSILVSLFLWALRTSKGGGKNNYNNTFMMINFQLIDSFRHLPIWINFTACEIIERTFSFCPLIITKSHLDITTCRKISFTRVFDVAL